MSFLEVMGKVENELLKQIDACVASYELWRQRGFHWGFSRGADPVTLEMYKKMIAMGLKPTEAGELLEKTPMAELKERFEKKS